MWQENIITDKNRIISGNKILWCGGELLNCNEKVSQKFQAKMCLALCCVVLQFALHKNTQEHTLNYTKIKNTDNFTSYKFRDFVWQFICDCIGGSWCPTWKVQSNKLLLLFFHFFFPFKKYLTSVFSLVMKWFSVWVKRFLW